MSSGSEAHITYIGQAGGAARAVALQGHYAVIGVGTQVVIVNASDPGDPREVYRSPVLGGIVVDVTVVDHIAYALHGRSLLVLDVARPEEPQVLSNKWFPFMYSTRGILVHDGYAYVLMDSMSDYSVHVIDVRDPTAPELLEPARRPDYGAGPFGWPQDLAAEGSFVYAASGDGLLVVDVSDPTDPIRVGEAAIAEKTAWAVDLADGYAYVASTGLGSGNSGGMLIYEVSDPTQPRLVGSNDLPCRSIATDGRYAYLGLWPNGLAVVDIADPRHPVTLRIEDFDQVADIAAQEGRVFSAAPQSGVDMLYSQVPPVLHATVLETWAPVVDVVAAPDGSLIAFAAHAAGLAVVDLSTPSAPKSLADLALPDGAVRLAAAEDRVYVATDGSTVQIVDVAKPGAPALLASVVTDGRVVELAASGPPDGHLLVLAEESRLRVLDVTDPEQPRDVGTVEFEYWEPTAVAIADGFAYVADRPVGLRVFKLSDSGDPAEVSRVEFRTHDWGRARGLALAGTRLYVPHGSEALPTPGALPDRLSVPPPPPMFRILEIDISDPLDPHWTRDLPPMGWPRGLTVLDGGLYVASGVADYYTMALLVRGIGTDEGLEDELMLPAVPRGITAVGAVGSGGVSGPAGANVIVADADAGLLVVEMGEGPVSTPTPMSTPTSAPTPAPTPDRTSQPPDRAPLFLPRLLR